MSVTVRPQFYSTDANDEHRKHMDAIKFCSERGLSFPAETARWLRDIDPEDDLNGYNVDYVLKRLSAGMPLGDGSHACVVRRNEYEFDIDVSMLPEGTTLIKVVAE